MVIIYQEYISRKEQPSLTISIEYKNTTTCSIGNPGPNWGQAYKCDGVKPVKGIPTSLITGCPTTIHIYTYKDKKKYTYLLPAKNTTPYQKNEWHYKHGQYNSKANACW